MAQILVGITAWTEPTLIESGAFYPASARSAEARLRFYASQFPIVEVDSTYYALPAESTARLWVERTGQDFIFDIKAFRLFTRHPAAPAVLPKDLRQALPAGLNDRRSFYYRDLPSDVLDEVWHRFEQALLPLDSAGKLGVVLFQFPPWFLPGEAELKYIADCRRRLPQYRLAVEFRHFSWLNELNIARTLGFLRDHSLAYVCVDEPQGFASSVPPVVEATSDIGIVRFHGRNREAWEQENLTAAERFKYLYNDGELQEWAPRIRGLLSQADEVHALFNNCFLDYAVNNARTLRLMFD